MDLLEHRLERLELSNKRLKRTLALALLLAGSVVLMAQGGKGRGMLQGEALALVQDGHKYAEIGKWKGGSGLRLFDTEGEVRCELALSRGKRQWPGLWLHSEGNGAASLAVGSKVCSLSMASGDDSSRAVLRLHHDTASLDLTAGRRKGQKPPYHAAVATNTLGASFNAWGRGGELAILGVPGTNADDPEGPLVVLKDTRGQPRAMLGLDKHGNPGLAVFDDSRTTRAAIGFISIREADGRFEYLPIKSPVVTYDQGGKPTWKAP